MNGAHVERWLDCHRAYARLRFVLNEELGLHHGVDADDLALLHLLAQSADGALAFADLAAALGASGAALLRRLRPLQKVGLLDCDGALHARRVTLRAAGLRLVHTARDTVGAVLEGATSHAPAGSWLAPPDFSPAAPAPPAPASSSR